MPESILVTYATIAGSTKEVAEAIAATLRSRGLAAQTRPMKEISSIVQYEAVVMGAPIHFGHWHKDALRFLTQHSVALITRPVAVFALGPLRPDEGELRVARGVLDKALANYSWLAPVALEVFVGKYDPANRGFPETLLLKLPASILREIVSDRRDWEAIRAWADNLADKLKVGQKPAIETA
jgi:menaquinone-dependent protoporphyrinogen oxidase